jgi:hypothetical protein
MAKRHVSISTGFISFFLLMFSTAHVREQGYLARGSSISTEDDTITILVSPNGEFSCGFYKVATNAFTSVSTQPLLFWTAQTKCD